MVICRGNIHKFLGVQMECLVITNYLKYSNKGKPRIFSIYVLFTLSHLAMTEHYVLIMGQKYLTFFFRLFSEIISFCDFPNFVVMCDWNILKL